MIARIVFLTAAAVIVFGAGYLTALGPIGRALLWERVRDHLGGSS